MVNIDSGGGGGGGAHAQKVMTSPSNPQSVGGKMDSLGMPCKYFQTGKCPNKNDHTTSGQLYRYICTYCITLGKRFTHPLKDCCNEKDQDL